MKKLKVKRELKPLADAALAQGWQVEMSGGGHIKFTPPPGRGCIGYTPASPSDHRAYKNFRSFLVRQGLVLQRLRTRATLAARS